MSNWRKLVQEAQDVVDRTYREMAVEMRVHAEKIPVTFEPIPSPEMEEEGIEPETLGLFVGESHDIRGQASNPMPGQILLFLQNIWDFAEEDMESYREEVSVTLLHEIGHYLGLGEEDLFERGLD